MTVEAMVLARDSEVAAQVTPVLRVEDWELDGSLSAEQMEAIVRAWKGQAVGQDVPLSPVGEWDVDGTLSLGKSNVSDFVPQCDSYDPIVCASYTYFDTRQWNSVCLCG